MEKRQSIAFRRGLCALLGAVAGIAVFLMLYGTMTLNVTNDGWILNGYDETDIQQHYAGWLLFRNSHWTFPLGMCDTLAIPDGTILSYTDSLPWVSILFKLLRGFLPSTFQWFGWYTLFCFAMQGMAGALLCTRGKMLASRVAPLFGALGGLLFACLPTLWERAFRHVALASQYLFLFGLYFYLEYRTALYNGKAPRWAWALFPLLGFAAVGIHPYFLPPVMICALLAAVDLARIARRPGAGAGLFGVSILAALAGGFLTGALGSGVEVSRDGYGGLSMNLNAVLNPQSRGGYVWSRLLPQQFQYPEQYDGFNYLGLGVLVLVLCRLAVPHLAHRACAGKSCGLVAAESSACACVRVSHAVRGKQQSDSLELAAQCSVSPVADGSVRNFPLQRANVLPGWGLYGAVRCGYHPGRLRRNRQGAGSRLPAPCSGGGIAAVGPLTRGRAETATL